MSQGERSALEQAIVALEQYIEQSPKPAEGGGLIPPGLLGPPRLRTILMQINDVLANTADGDPSKRIEGLHALSQFVLTWESAVDSNHGSVITFKFSDLQDLADTLRALLPI